MKTFAIVSSFSESCGNAYFTRVLMDGIEATGLRAVCVSLDLSLTQAIEPSIRKKAEAHIDVMCRELRTADAVNIQFEAGLYGTLPSDILRRFKKLISANKNTSVTLHSPRLLGASSGYRDVIKLALSGRVVGACKKFLDISKNNIYFNLNRQALRAIVSRNLPIIVHTLRASEQIKLLFNYTNVDVHPLKFVDIGYVPDGSKFSKLKREYAIPPDGKVIGLFGYVSSYKGHTAALKALTRLPHDYYLFIFGRVHPQTLKIGQESDPYMESLNSYVDVNKLNRRVFFIGEVETEDFVDYAAAVDCVWLPYLEVGQDGSGIASICCDVSNNVIASTAFAFDELLKLIPYPTIRRFDIGNTIELAQKTSLPLVLNNNEQVKNSKYTTHSQAELYAKILTESK